MCDRNVSVLQPVALLSVACASHTSSCWLQRANGGSSNANQQAHSDTQSSPSIFRENTARMTWPQRQLNVLA